MKSSRSGPVKAPERNPGPAGGQGAVAVLWTGFGAFGEHAWNPSSAVAEAAFARRGDTDAVEQLDVTWGAATSASGRWFEGSGRRIAIHVGLAGDRSWISLESVARNVCNDTPDVLGERRPGTLVPDGVDVRTTALPLDRLRACLAPLTSLEVRVTDDAGSYVCNATYYHALARAREAGGDALFVHVPPMDLESARRVGAALADAITSLFA